MTRKTNPYALQYSMFLKEIEEHQLVVHHEVDVLRHLTFGKPGVGCWSMSVVTWPGHLATSGDIGSGYVFTRLYDMLNFFHVPDHLQDYYEDHAPSIDFRYWSEKLSGGRSVDVKVYSSEVFLDVCREMALDYLDTQICDGNIAKDLTDDEVETLVSDRDKLAEKLSESSEITDFLREAQDASHFKETAMSFLQDQAGDGNIVDQDWYEHDFTEYDSHFVYACYMLNEITRRYHARPEHEQVDDYILVDGGLVQNTTTLPVFDLDILSSDNPGTQDVDEVRELRVRLLAHSGAKVAREQEITRMENFIRAYGDHSQVADLEIELEKEN